MNSFDFTRATGRFNFHEFRRGPITSEEEGPLFFC